MAPSSSVVLLAGVSVTAPPKTDYASYCLSAHCGMIGLSVWFSSRLFLAPETEETLASHTIT